MFEQQGDAVIPARHFLLRVSRHVAMALAILAGSLVIGMLGYHAIEGMAWIDAFLNAAMILTGMGPVGDLKTDAGKIFAACYAIYSGSVFLVVVCIVMAPVLHRFLHRFHADDADPD